MRNIREILSSRGKHFLQSTKVAVDQASIGHKHPFYEYDGPFASTEYEGWEPTSPMIPEQEKSNDKPTSQP